MCVCLVGSAYSMVCARVFTNLYLKSLIPILVQVADRGTYRLC